MTSAFQLQKLDVTLSLSLPQTGTMQDVLKPQERSMKLIQLLLACASHASSGNLHHADVCLHDISQLASVTGDSMQRLSARFASALASRLVRRWPGLFKALNSVGTVSCDLDHAWSVFIQKLPCLSFAYAVINQTLIRAMWKERAIHVIDLGSGDPQLWVPFLRDIADGADEPPHLTITCVVGNQERLQKLQAELRKEAACLNVPFQFNSVNASLRELNLGMLNLKADETVALTSVLALHTLLAEDDAQFRFTGHSEVKGMGEFLDMVKLIKPKVLLLVEQEANHNSTRLVDRVVEGLNYYSALFDSIDMAYNGFSCLDRSALEETLGMEIENIVAGEGREREERHERYAKWGVRLSRAGLRPVRLWYDTMEAARHVVESYRPEGFKVVTERGSLRICWHDRPLYAVSAWDCFNLHADVFVNKD